MQAYFLGKKDLFSGLALEQKELELEQEEGREPWLSYPVLYLDLNSKEYVDGHSLEEILDKNLSEWEREYGIRKQYDSASLRFPIFWSRYTPRVAGRSSSWA